VVDRDGIWSRGGMPVEELPDPFASEALPDSGTLIPEWPVPQPP
jgi:hypothetical protein